MDAQFTRLLLRSLLWTAQDNGASLYDTLKAAARARLEETAAGKVLVGVSQRGLSTTFALPPGDLGPLDVTRTLARLLDLYDAALLAAPTATDAELAAAMTAQIKPVNAVGSNFVNLYK